MEERERERSIHYDGVGQKSAREISANSIADYGQK